MPASSSTGRRLSLSTSGQSIRSCSLLTASGLASTKASSASSARRASAAPIVAADRRCRSRPRRASTRSPGPHRRARSMPSAGRRNAVDDLDADDEAVVLPPLGAANGAVLVAALADRAPVEVGDAQRFAGGLKLVTQHAVGRRGVAEVDDDDVEAQLRERRVLVHADVGALAGEEHVGVRAVGVRQPCPVAERSVDAGVGELAVHRRPVDEGTRTERRVRLDRGVGHVGEDAGQPGPGRVERGGTHRIGGRHGRQQEAGETRRPWR